MPSRTHSLKITANLALFAFLAAAALAKFAHAQTGYDGAFWQRPPASPGDWFDAANWNPGPPGALATATIDNGGTAVISAGHAEALGGWIGFSNDGALRITGGSATFHWSVTLGYLANSLGRIRVEGGDLIVEGALQLGAGGGRGQVEQIGGEVQTGNLTLGGRPNTFVLPASPSVPEDYGHGRYRLAGGALHAQYGAVGNSGVGRFIQDGGRAEFAGNLVIGGQLSEFPGEVQPSVDTFENLPAINLPVTLPTEASLPYPPDVIFSYWPGLVVPSRGLYEFNHGELEGGNLLVNRTGAYRQNGGAAEFDFAAIHEEGKFRLRGGEFHAELGFHSDNAVNLGGQEVALSVGSGILDLSNGINGAQNAHVAAGAHSLTILPAGFNPNTGFGTFNRQGMVHVAGNDLVVPAGKRIAGAGVIDDFVTARGQIAATSYGINLAKGLRLNAGASVDLGDGALTAIGRTSTFQGGSLAARRLIVGGTLHDPWDLQFNGGRYYYPQLNDPQLAEPGVIRHHGGDVTIAQRATVLSGEYRISGGTLEADSIDVGVNQFTPLEYGPISARFTQTGGIVRTSSLSLAQSYLYFLAFDGTPAQVRPNSMAISDSIAPGDEPSVWVPTDPVVAEFIMPPAIHATYRLAGGELYADAVNLAQSWMPDSKTRFIQTGGSLVSNRIGMHGADTSYVMHGGQLTTRRLEIGAQYVLTNPEFVVNDSASFAVRNAESDIEIRGELLFGGGSQFRAVPGTTIRMTNPGPAEYQFDHLPASSVRNLSFDADNLAGLKNLTLVFDGQTDEASTFEVAGLDLGAGPAGYQHNFALAGLTLGGDDPAFLRLVDLFDNQRNGDFNEALYVDTLIVGAGSTLDLGAINLYYRHAQIDGTVLSGAGALLAATQVPEPAAAAMLLAAALSYRLAANKRLTKNRR